jgi:histidinol dehydrogenase
VRRVAATKHTERVAHALAGRQSGVVLVDDIEAGITVVNAYAAEHLEIQTRDARAVAARIRNAGAIFVAPFAPVSLGDYCAGSNHVLPTGGCACHSSGLSVQSFLRGIHVVDYTRPPCARSPTTWSPWPAPRTSRPRRGVGRSGPAPPARRRRR